MQRLARIVAPGPLLDLVAGWAALLAADDAEDLYERLRAGECTGWPCAEAGLIVILYGWALLFVIVLAALVQATYLYLIWRVGSLQEWSWKSLGILIGVSVISFAASEAIATYIFVNFWTASYGVDNRVNAPPLVLNASLLAFLWWKARPRPEQCPLHAR